jgi:glycosyltransferase involved in cell wall biosynthesis
MNTQFFKHVVFVTDFFAPHLGGLETVFFHLTKNLVDKGYRVTVLTSQFDPLLPDHEMMHGVEIVRWGSGRFSFMIETFWRGYTYFKQADIIHTTTCLSIYPAWFWARWFDKIALITVHEVYGQLWKKLHGRWVGSLYMFVERVSFLLPFDMYHCVSRYTKNCLRTLYGIDDAKMLTIYNGVDHEFWNTQRLDPIKITTIRQTL